MAGMITDLSAIGSIDRTTDLLEIVDLSANASFKVTVNNLVGISGGSVVSTSDSQTLTNKTITAPAISAPVLSGTITGTYTLGGTPTFPAAVVTLTGSQTLTNKILTSPTINGGTIDNATVTVDAVAGHTSSTSGTIYGVAVTSAQITGANTVTNTALATGIQTSKFTNPYKFSVYRNTAFTAGNTVTSVLPCDTKIFDTGSNVDIVTNKGRFTAPVAGFWQFNGFGTTSLAGGAGFGAFIGKNGAIVGAGYEGVQGTSGGFAAIAGASAFLQLVAGDYVELFFYGSGGTGGTGPAQNGFNGFLVSTT